MYVVILILLFDNLSTFITFYDLIFWTKKAKNWRFFNHYSGALLHINGFGYDHSHLRAVFCM
jgi:hypothetical protein